MRGIGNFEQGDLALLLIGDNPPRRDHSKGFPEEEA